MTSVKGRATTRQKRRERLYEQQGGKCHYCKRHMTLAKSEKPLWNYATFEHVCPRSDGGDDREENIVLACWKCNNKRSYHTFIDMRGMFNNRRAA